MRSQLMRNEAELTKAVETIGRLQQQVQEVRQSVSTALVSYALHVCLCNHKTCKTTLD